MVTQSTPGRLKVTNKIKLLCVQVESFLYNILPFQCYASVVTQLQEQVEIYALKEQLYLKMTEKFQHKSHKAKTKSTPVLQALV